MSQNLLIPFFTAGYPSLNSTNTWIDYFCDYNIPYLEIGLPHSDALADGIVIQNSSSISLANGMNIKLLFDQIENLQYSKKTKLILFSYYNPILRYGIEKTIQKWASIGGHAILIPDLPIEQTHEIKNICQINNIKIIYLIAPTSTEERISKILKNAQEFVYLVAYAGVTGTNNNNNQNNKLKEIILQINNERPDLKTVIGFGINNGKKAKEAIELGANGVVIGSAIVKLMQEENAIDKIDELMKELTQELN